MRKYLAIAVAILAFALAAAPAGARGDKDCSDFSTWKQAQRFYERHGGPRRDPHRLDADRDGIACEALR
ncbi:MAG TPA: excalibur calcium-binding domain-containing protein [Solirubrobacterales bacterium]|nr:excalibur calcium-binding domain-containing protein [Solirubrobacterales bacterium]